MKRQQTIQKEAELSGRGLFTGFPVTVRFRPAPANTGIVFVRNDQPEPISVTATVDHLTKRARRTALRNGTVSIETVEHCLAAVRGLEIDNLTIEINNAEVPGLDGSARPFVDALAGAGVAELDAERRIVYVREPVRVVEGDAELVAWPGDGDYLEILYELDYGERGSLGRQFHRFRVEPEAFAKEIAPARTFVTEAEATALRSAGMGTHLTYQDILVIGPDGPIENEYRFENECVRHKILDLIGDLMLIGTPVAGTVYARKSGHSLNHQLARKLLEQDAQRELAARLAGGPKLDVRGVQRILPHRYPMLLVDRVLEMDGDRRAVGVKNVTINEPFFLGHYPRQPIMPGVLLIEAMAQLGGLLLSQKLEHTGKVAILLSLDRAKFRRPVTPGDQVILEATKRRLRSRTGEVFCRALVGGDLAAEATIRFMLVDADPV